MKRSETIIVRYVQPELYKEYNGKYAGQWLVHVCGVSDNPKKLMKLQVWEMPFTEEAEAKKTLADYLEQISKGTFMIIRLK